MPLLDPVIVTLYEPADPEQDRVELPSGVVVLKIILVGDRLHARPEEGETVLDRVTVPKNPSRLLVVIVEVPVTPARTVTLAGDGIILKS